MEEEKRTKKNMQIMIINKRSLVELNFFEVRITQLDKWSLRWNSCQQAVKTENNSCQTDVTKFDTLESKVWSLNGAVCHISSGCI